MFDPNNDVNYSPGGYSPGNDMYGPQEYDMNGGKPQINIKKYLPLIIGLGVLLIVTFFLLTWLGSQREIWIGITDADGKSISGTLKLTDSSGNLVETNPKGTSTKFKVTLFPGDYYARVTAEGHKTKESEVITIDGETEQDSTQNIELVRNLNATLTTIIETTKIYEGQRIEGKLVIFNSGNEFNIEDVIPSATTPLEVEIRPTTLTSLNAGGSANLDFYIEVKEGTNLTEQVSSKITFKIKGSNVSSKDFTINVIPTLDPTKLTITGLTTNSVDLTAGITKEVNITLDNKDDKIPLENVLVEIVPSQNYESTLDWITIASINDESAPNEIIIPSINPKSKVSIKMYVKSPISAKLNEEFIGVVRVTSLSLKGEKLSNIFSYKIDRETKVNLFFNMPDDFKINCSESTGICKGEETLAIGEVYFENKGDVDIGAINLEIDLTDQATTANCPSFLTLNTTYIPSLPKKTKYENISLEVVSPPESAPNVTEICVIKWTYNNPLDPTIRETGKKQIRILKKTT